MMVSIKRILVIAAFCVGPMTFGSIAQAEKLSIEGLYPAREAGLTNIKSISIEPFGGSDGSALAFEIEDVLSHIMIYDEPYFQIMSARTAIVPESTITGQATTGIETYDTEEYRSRCVERNDKGKCTKHKDIEVPCERRVIDFKAQVRISRYSDGQTIYSGTKPDSHEQTICLDDDGFESSEKIIGDMIAKAAWELRLDLAPIYKRQSIRILESRKGMAKSEAKFFKAAVKMTKSGESAACRMWDEASANGTAHGSIAYNRGLCAEMRGDLSGALDIYAEAGQLMPKKSKTRSAIDRVLDRRRALNEWEMRTATVVAEKK